MSQNEEKKADEIQDEEKKSEETKASEQDSKETEKKELTAEEKIEELTKENADLKDQLMRRVADFDNYRKRMIKEKQDTFDYANKNLLQDLLESLDNLDRALQAAETTDNVKAVADGVKMISKNLVSMLESKYSLESYGVEGDSFDPDKHEAIGSVPGAVADPVLKAVYLKGYKLKDRIIRHAKVMVTMPDGSVAKEEKSSDEKKDEKEKK